MKAEEHVRLQVWDDAGEDACGGWCAWRVDLFWEDEANRKRAIDLLPGDAWYISIG